MQTIIKIYCCLPSYAGYGHVDYIIDMMNKAQTRKDRIELFLRPWMRNKVDMNVNMSIHEFLFDPKYKDYDYWVAMSQDCLPPANWTEYPLKYPEADLIFGWTIFGYPPYFPTIGRMTYHPQNPYWEGQFSVKYLYAGIPFWCDDNYIPKTGAVWNDLVGFAAGMFVKRSVLAEMVKRRPEPFKFPIDYTSFPCQFMTEDGFFVQHMVADGCWKWVFDYAYKINHLSNPLFPRDLQDLRRHYSAQIMNLFTEEALNRVREYFGYPKPPPPEELEQIFKEAEARRLRH